MPPVKPTDVLIRNLSFDYEEVRYRAPLKFGGTVVDKATILNVRMVVETVAGKVARGFGSMPLGNAWAWPSTRLNYSQTLAGMKKIAAAVADIYAHTLLAGHPIRITHELEPDILAWAVGHKSFPEPVPELATRVAASAFDAALHDAYGKAHELNCYKTYTAPFFEDDLGDYLGNDFRGERLDSYLNAEPAANLPLYHLVGAVDPLSSNDITRPIGDGRPEHLGEWILRDDLTHLKIKLNGDDSAWDLQRILAVDRSATETAPERKFRYSLDFNERCPNAEYLVEILMRLKSETPKVFERIEYIEQPGRRDLLKEPKQDWHAASKLKPLVIDEALLGLETLDLARDQGYTGVAFKACKGQTQSLLLAAATQKRGLFRCVQDLTCPGASLIQSAGLAAHIPGIAAVEANSRQYCPAANESYVERFPGIIEVRDGRVNTGMLTGMGLGAV